MENSFSCQISMIFVSLQLSLEAFVILKCIIYENNETYINNIHTNVLISHWYVRPTCLENFKIDSELPKHKKSLKIPKGYSETLIRRTDKQLSKEKRQKHK